MDGGSCLSRDLYYIDTETGEIEPFVGTVITEEQRKIIHAKRTKQIQYNDGPTFIWVMFRYGDQIFPGMQSANLTRLIYASTFCDSSGHLMSKSDLKKQMRLSKDAWCSFWSEMEERNIFYIKDGDVYINTSYFTKWTLAPNVNKNYTRMYCTCVRNFYESCTRMTDHKRMSYIFKIIPFVSRRYNIMCKNPWEIDKNKIIPMDVGDVCEVLGQDRSHARRVLRELLKIKIDSVPAVYFAGNNLNEDTWKLFVSPNVYYGGEYGVQRQEVVENYKKLIES